MPEETRIERLYDQRDFLAPAAARRVVDELPDLDPRVRSDLTLAVSELVANAVRHAPVVEGGQVLLVLESDPDGVRAEVHDPGNGFDPTPDPARHDGRGLSIVAAVADGWGLEAGAHTVVWCRLSSRGQHKGASAD